MESAKTQKSEALRIAAGTLKNRLDLYCVEDSEIMRERQCMSQLRELSELVRFDVYKQIYRSV